MDKQQLLDNLYKLCAGTDADVSVLWREIGPDADVFAFEADKVMTSASMIKIPIMLAVFDEVRCGRLSLERKIAVGEHDILGGSRVFDAGAREASIEELVAWMIILSDNTATNVLIDLVGFEAVNAYCAQAGAGNTLLRRKMPASAAGNAGLPNLTSMRDVFLLYSMLEARAILTPQLCATALGILKRQRHRSRMLRYIWEDVAVAHKTGDALRLTHDAGVFYVNGKPYFLGIFLQNCAEESGNPKLAGKIARLVLDYYLRNPQ